MPNLFFTVHCISLFPLLNLLSPKCFPGLNFLYVFCGTVLFLVASITNYSIFGGRTFYLFPTIFLLHLFPITIIIILVVGGLNRSRCSFVLSWHTTYLFYLLIHYLLPHIPTPLFPLHSDYLDFPYVPLPILFLLPLTFHCGQEGKETLYALPMPFPSPCHSPTDDYLPKGISIIIYSNIYSLTP